MVKVVRITRWMISPRQGLQIPRVTNANFLLYLEAGVMKESEEITLKKLRQSPIYKYVKYIYGVNSVLIFFLLLFTFVFSRP